MKIIINYFKDTELFLTANLLNMFSQKYNHYLYLQHNTFFRFLSEDSQSYLRNMLLAYRNSLALSDDPMDFVYYVLNNRQSAGFKKICCEIENVRESGFKKSCSEKSISDELFYTIQGYFREDNADKMYSIFDGSELHTLASGAVDFSVFTMSRVKFLLKRLLNYDMGNFKDIESVILMLSDNIALNSEIETALVTFMLLNVFSAWKEKPERMYWEDIICKALRAEIEATTEVLDTCYMNF